VRLTLGGDGAYDERGNVLGGDRLGDVHEFFANVLLEMVLWHLALITGLSLLRRKNQALPMLTCRVEGAGPVPVKPNWVRLEMLLLCTVVAFPAWEWHQSPNGLVPLQMATGAVMRRDHDD
jgi:hypothetical protein